MAEETTRPDSRPEVRSRRTGAARIWLALGAALMVVVVANGLAGMFARKPDAVLDPISGQATFRVAGSAGVRLDEVELPGLTRHQPFHGIEPWSGADRFGSPCLVLVERASDTVLEAVCTPPDGELIATVEAWPALDLAFAEGLPGGSIIRFHLRENSVDAYVYPTPGER